jgi:DNA repair protein RecN (Recombination protein N)
MLHKLHIQNYAIIDDLMIDFSHSLNIITGETGAGKSILMGALNLILGERADSSILQQKEKKCVVEGFFKIEGKKNIKQFLLQNDLDAEDELVVRREIATNGKSRAFINDTPVNVTQLKTLSTLLVDLHQQFDTLDLGNANFQREVLDALANNSNLINNHAEHFAFYKKNTTALEELKLQQTAANASFDYNKFLFDELEEANFVANELEDLDAELKLLSNAENIKSQLGNVFFELAESEQPIVQQLKMLNNKLQSLTQYHPELEFINKRLTSSQIEIQDIASDIERINNTVQYSAERIQVVNDKIAIGYKLLKKHNVTSTNDLIALKELLQQKLTGVLNIGEEIKMKEQQVLQSLHQCKTAALIINGNRNKTIKPFTEKVNALLKQVGMPNAQIQIKLTTVALNEFGSDEIEFLFDANKSNRFEPLRKVASGGELSRLMLCIKYLVAQKLQLPTLIFDEIDTGISGEAAKQVGNIMKELSQQHQLIAITHQPQIAAKADAHYFVYKAIKEDKIITSIKLLSNDERITTIAQMLSGEKPTAAALQNAREMVGN